MQKVIDAMKTSLDSNTTTGIIDTTTRSLTGTSGQKLIPTNKTPATFDLNINQPTNADKIHFSRTSTA